RDNAVLTTLLDDNAFNNVDMIIGPSYKSQVSFLTSKNLDAPMILPFVSDEAILKSNPDIIMLNPSKQDICNAIASYAKQTAKCNPIIVKGTSEESKNYASRLQTTMSGFGISATVLNSTGGSIEAIASSLKKDAENLIVLTYDDEMAINRTMLQVFKLTGDHKIRLIADPKIMNYENIDPSYFAGVNYTYFSNSNVNYGKESTKSFIEKYHNAFLCEPSSDSYLGADAINYFVPVMAKAGKNFAACVDEDDVYEGLGGLRQYLHASAYSKNSYSNKIVFLFGILEDYSSELIYPTDLHGTNENE
ncbi:MAG: hypothetical protein HUK15_06630, partial [Bacteroidales bacterium]|nr:hypothetical protein [Bacteroidales bacterium]